MKIIQTNFKDENDKIITITTIVVSIFLFFIPPLLVVLYGKKYISESSYELAKALFNFELLLFLISLIFTIPFIGWLLGLLLAPLMTIFNFIIMIITLCSIAKETEIKIPVLYEFI